MAIRRRPTRYFPLPPPQPAPVIIRRAAIRTHFRRATGPRAIATRISHSSNSRRLRPLRSLRQALRYRWRCLHTGPRPRILPFSRLLQFFLMVTRPKWAAQPEVVLLDITTTAATTTTRIAREVVVPRPEEVATRANGPTVATTLATATQTTTAAK